VSACELARSTLTPTPAFILPTIKLKNGALLALIGTIVITVLPEWNFVSDVLNVLRGVDAPVLIPSFIYAFGCFTVMVFLLAFHRAQR
jgi:hypothetical protein